MIFHANGDQKGAAVAILTPDNRSKILSQETKKDII